MVKLLVTLAIFSPIVIILVTFCSPEPKTPVVVHKSWSDINISNSSQSAAADNNPSSLLKRGLQYSRGDGVQIDDTKAYEYIKKAASLDHAESIMHLGLLYSLGRGVKQDEQEASRLIKIAAEKGSAEAQLVLATRFSSGTGVQKDIMQAHRWASESAAQGYRPAYGLIKIIDPQLTPAQLKEAYGGTKQ